MNRRRRHSGGVEDDIKFAPGVGARVPASQRPLGVLERVTLAHVAIFVIAATWTAGRGAFVTPLAWWGSLGLLLALTAVQDRDAWRDGWMRPLFWLWPFLAFNALTLLLCLNPGAAGDTETAPLDGARAGFNPTSTPVALRTLWIFDGAWIACFNLALIIRQRRGLRLLLLIAVTNAVALAVLGGAQKFTGARDIFFRPTPTPRGDFVATFLNHQHWGAFVFLMIAAGLALVWHYGRRKEARAFFQTPAFAGIVVIGILTATLPASLAPACTALAVALIAAALVHACIRMIQRRRQFRESVVLPVAGAVAAVLLGIAAIWFVFGDNNRPRDRAEPPPVAGKTWELAQERPWFGWGMGSVSRDAGHSSDGALTLAEHGVVGSLFIVLCAVVPLLRLRPRHLTSPVPLYLLAGCALLLIDAGLGRPFESFAVVLSWWVCFFSAVHYARLQDREMPTAKSSSGGVRISPTANCTAAV